MKRAAVRGSLLSSVSGRPGCLFSSSSAQLAISRGWWQARSSAVYAGSCTTNNNYAAAGIVAGWRSAYHTAPILHARLVEAVITEDAVVVTEETKKKSKKSLLEMTPEEYEAYRQEKTQQEQVLKEAIDKMEANIFCKRLLHLFKIKKPPKLQHLHILLKKVKGPIQFKQAVDLMKWYQATLIETNQETAKLLMEAAIRARSLKVALSLFGSPLTWRLWPTPEMFDIAIDYYMAKDQLRGVAHAFDSFQRRRDMTPSREVYDKVINFMCKKNHWERAVRLSERGAWQLNLPSWPEEWCDNAAKIVFKTADPEAAKRFHDYRAGVRAPFTPAARQVSCWLKLLEGDVAGAVKESAEFLNSETPQEVRDTWLKELVFQCGRNEFAEKTKGHMEQLAAELPKASKAVANADVVLALWQEKEAQKMKVKERREKELARMTPEEREKWAPYTRQEQTRMERRVKLEEKMAQEQKRKAKLKRKREHDAAAKRRRKARETYNPFFAWRRRHAKVQLAQELKLQAELNAAKDLQQKKIERASAAASTEKKAAAGAAKKKKE